MKHCPNGDLFKYIIEHQRFSVLEAKYYLKKIIVGLQYVLSLGIVHRDLKPEKLFFNGLGRIKIGDFGLSRFVNSQGLANTPCGSVCYASPECIIGSTYDGRKSDVWSEGVIAYAMLVGVLPWTKRNQSQLLEQIRKTDFLFPSFIPDDPRDLITKMLDPDPCRRISVEQCLHHPWIKSAPNVRPMYGSTGKNLLISLKHVDNFFDRDNSEEKISIKGESLHLARSYSMINDSIENTLKRIVPKEKYNTARQAARAIILKKK